MTYIRLTGKLSRIGEPQAPPYLPAALAEGTRRVSDLVRKFERFLPRMSRANDGKYLELK